MKKFDMAWFTPDGKEITNSDQLLLLAGIIPLFVSAENKDKAEVQFDENYSHGGGWSPFGEGKWVLGDDDSLTYPSDPTYNPVAFAFLRNQKIVVYRHAWVAIIEQDRTFQVARMD